MGVQEILVVILVTGFYFQAQVLSFQNLTYNPTDFQVLQDFMKASIVTEETLDEILKKSDTKLEISNKRRDGKKVAEQIRGEIAAEVLRMKDAIGIVPNLAVILFGDREESATYVSKKEACEVVGINSFEVHFPEDATEHEVLNSSSGFNDDPPVHGILVQLPLPSHMDEQNILNAVSIEKDVDGFHLLNIGCLAMGGKRAVVIGRSNIVGMPGALLLQREDATVSIVHSRTKNPKELTRQADIKPPIHSSAFSPSQLSEDATEQEVLNSVSGINDDPPVHGILVQLPLPSHMDEQNILNAVSIEKDVDGFHLLNIGCLAMRGREPCLFPVLQKAA
ncbi:hypothetical protein M0R45_002095 [Rubus argutus]|uniref:Methenyltetrahydrofolate cyclohydrolase n=1 Tax=Rubus argutus TaxID=59490 RepID=A0AAW1VJK9_RUBAR